MILVAGVGYQHLSDLSFGSVIVERMREMEWPENVRIEDFGWGPISILHWFEASPGKKFDRAVFVGAIERGRGPGKLYFYPWPAEKPDPEIVQERISEALTGVISLENLLIIAQHFDALPPDTLVVELEPVEREWGSGMGEIGRQRMTETIAWIRKEVHARPYPNGRKEVRNR
ncbi:hydrogenase maturation protease [Rubrobacter indicoceani]|uniref:hydrogenase maturation protease n=1 Tax=Rubrobacter indicoceani TaxID=2051957 RepID=UPI000E5C33A3|nr:hydrogenase maturation protease [Rubrobacter indicoceani]